MRVILFIIISLFSVIECQFVAQKPDFKRSFNEINSRIVGGVDANPGDCPSQCAIVNLALNQLGPICGCSIINETFVLTAAHCCEPIVGLEFLTDISYGSTKWTSILPFIVPVPVDVKRIIVHPYYNNITTLNDICVIETKSEMSLGKTQAQQANLGIANYDPPPGTDATAYGWGLRKDSDIVQPLALQKVVLPIYERVKCRSVYGNATDTINLVSDTMVCAGGFPEGGKDICSGDSGGPLIIGVGKTGVQIGIVSKGVCGLPDGPGIYTLVSKFLNFIRYNIAVP